MMKRSQRDLGWLEGIVDGEGSLSLQKNRAGGRHTKRGFAWAARLQISSSDESIVLRVKSIIGEGAISVYDPSTDLIYGYQHKKKRYLYALANAGIRRLLPELHFIAKERRRELLLEAVLLLQDHARGNTPHDNRLEEIWQEMRRLNS